MNLKLLKFDKERTRKALVEVTAVKMLLVVGANKAKRCLQYEIFMLLILVG